MKIIQSFWSRGHVDLLKFNAGWYAPEYHLMGWALSCLQLKRYYKNVILYTDDIAAKMLIDILELPYSDAICNMDNIDNYHTQLWALPKINTYALQTTPFLHVDGDVFIWEPFDETLLNGNLIAQNMEFATSFYENTMLSLETHLTYMPNEITLERNENNTIYAYNAGILGGSDIDFFRLYTQKAKEFIDKNTCDLDKINIGSFNIFFEQYLFYCLAKHHNKQVKLLLSDLIPDNEYIGFGDFNEIPHNKKYLHLIGTYKRHKSVCEQMANRLRLDYPEYYYRIIALFKTNHIPLKKDYYYFIENPTENSLLTRYRVLKNTNKAFEEFKKNETQQSKRTVESKIQWVENIFTIIRDSSFCHKENKYAELLADYQLFENKLFTIIKTKFVTVSNEYLYSRDVKHTEYFQHTFNDKRTILQKKIVKDELTEIIESRFDWTDLNAETIKSQLEQSASNFYAVVIPECDYIGYSLSNLDELDLMLLEILKSPLSINEVLNEARSAFDPSELESFSKEFEMIILGRIKIAIQNKIVKPIPE